MVNAISCDERSNFAHKATQIQTDKFMLAERDQIHLYQATSTADALLRRCCRQISPAQHPRKVHMLQVLDERDFPYKGIKMLSSARSAGKTYDFQGTTYTVEELKEDSFGDCDIALFSAGGGISKKFGPIASEAGCTVVDNSSAFRMTDGVPLVIPEVNADAMKDMKVTFTFATHKSICIGRCCLFVPATCRPCSAAFV